LGRTLIDGGGKIPWQVSASTGKSCQRNPEYSISSRDFAQFDPAWLGARIYRRDDVSELISKHQQLRPAKTHQSNSAEPIAAAKADISKSPENAEFCESDDVIL
jgi:hypothetical protein